MTSKPNSTAAKVQAQPKEKHEAATSAQLAQQKEKLEAAPPPQLAQQKEKLEAAPPPQLVQPKEKSESAPSAQLAQQAENPVAAPSQLEHRTKKSLPADLPPLFGKIYDLLSTAPQSSGSIPYEKFTTKTDKIVDPPKKIVHLTSEHVSIQTETESRLTVVSYDKQVEIKTFCNISYLSQYKNFVFGTNEDGSRLYFANVDTKKVAFVNLSILLAAFKGQACELCIKGCVTNNEREVVVVTRYGYLIRFDLKDEQITKVDEIPKIRTRQINECYQANGVLILEVMDFDKGQKLNLAYVISKLFDPKFDSSTDDLRWDFPNTESERHYTTEKKIYCKVNQQIKVFVDNQKVGPFLFFSNPVVMFADDTYAVIGNAQYTEFRKKAVSCYTLLKDGYQLRSLGKELSLAKTYNHIFFTADYGSLDLRMEFLGKIHEPIVLTPFGKFFDAETSKRCHIQDIVFQKDLCYCLVMNPDRHCYYIFKWSNPMQREIKKC